MKTKNSQELFEKSKKHIAGGVNSPVRAFKSVGGSPIFFKKSRGCYLYDEDGNKYLDFVGSWGPMVLGHSNKNIINAIKNQASKGISFGAPTKNELEIAKIIKSYLPSIEKLRMVNSGTEATMSCIRLARGTTNRKKIIKFIGCYHGHVDSLLVKAGSGLATLGVPDSPGIPEELSELTITLPYNDIDSLKDAFSKFSNDIAAVIIEPIAGNMGCVLPQSDFIFKIRELCTQNNTVLVFDEVMTGFRLALGGAQEVLGIDADLVTYGKVIGGGLPVGAFGGKKEIMNSLAPDGPVYQAGTLSGNPIAMSAGYAMLTHLKANKNIYESLDQKTKYLRKGFEAILNSNQLPYYINSIGSMISLHFTNVPVIDFESAKSGDNSYFKNFFHGMLANGVYLPPSAYESYFLNDAISYSDIDHTIKSFEKIISKI
jgi:glutamate-1-semialdehyde 2,1-aminomutase